jgi:hypothetical protein
MAQLLAEIEKNLAGDFDTFLEFVVPKIETILDDYY